MSLVNSEGSFWRDMRYTGVPGIDNLSQIRPGLVADFSKLAGPRLICSPSLVWEEEGGGPAKPGSSSPITNSLAVSLT